MDQSTILPLAGCYEPVSSLSHLLGALYFAWLGKELIWRVQGEPARSISLRIMTFSTVLLLVLSGFYHMTNPGPLREFMLRADVAAIFLLIAGSMTPVHAILFQGRARSIPLALIWITAMLGMALRIQFYNQITSRAGTMFFLLFGWCGFITFLVLLVRFGWKFVKPAFCCGMSYTLGAIALLCHRPTLISGVVGPHELWHIAVLAGLGFHWNFVYQFAVTFRDVQPAAAS